MDRIVRALRENHGAARRSELLAAGVTRHDLVSAIRTGAVLRPARGILALPDADPLLVRCLTTNSLLTCVSAARRHGLWVLKEHEEIHLQRADGRLASDRAVVHRGSWAPAAPAARTASVLDTVMHALHCLPDLEALVIVESALKKGLPMELVASLLRGPRNGPARAVLAMVDRGADSPAETLAREHLRRAGFFVEPQVLVDGVGSMDHIVERCLDLEIDGRTHQQPESRYSDYLRDGAAQARGFATLRVSYGDVVHRTAQVVRRVGAVVSARLAQGSLPVY
ncbi:very-short-patch-repair endonuclease [Sinomonas atrocyanea]|uniref:type IV toxin-antitoxin system AbiEi family antitoxin domain-containing protein n=1 Tax=Sinomonas atrocyanea TaxID=37927 RepID=UPI00277FDD07|nr:type IV toxin-antitoxin system AbiEi family antitoxin domain-containing protein [Sinomonas atrocyanea]MDP9884802.1 very-short-patch-repair endonuclease [Sinomonas atrocyanea]